MTRDEICTEIRSMLAANREKWEAALEADNRRQLAECDGASSALLALYEKIVG